MIIPDVNILLHAYNAESSANAAASAWLEKALRGSRTVGLAWVTILGFIRIATHRRVFRNPMTTPEVTDRVKEWLQAPCARIVPPGESHATFLFHLLESFGTAGNLTTDIHLAALALEYQAEIVSTDADFARFPRVRWYNPLAAHR